MPRRPEQGSNMPYTIPSSWKDLDVILAHDWLTGMRGGERCLELLCEGFPDAIIYTLIHNAEQVSDTINRHQVQASSMNRLPWIRNHFRVLLPLFPRFVEAIKPAGAEVMISTSHSVIKGLRPPEGTRHICYCFTPMRYGMFYNEYFGINPIKELVVRPMLSRLRAWDTRASDRVDRFIAISEHVRRRIRYFYGRESDVVYPPVDLDRCTPGKSGTLDFDLIVSALVPYKRIDLAVEAYSRLGYPLKIVGTGSQYRKLRKMAGPSIEFLGWREDEEVLDLYRNCRFLVFPGEEDFGIVPLEAQACGRPVVAFGRGGALESVEHGRTGIHFRRQKPEDLLAGIEEAAGQSWDTATIRKHSEKFGIQQFLNGIARNVDAEVE
jgi:glycosyltransferase involved in cell wall biosynthesis